MSGDHLALAFDDLLLVQSFETFFAPFAKVNLGLLETHPGCTVASFNAVRIGPGEAAWLEARSAGDRITKALPKSTWSFSFGVEVDFGEGAHEGASDDLGVGYVGGGTLVTTTPVIAYLEQLKIDMRQ